MRFDDFVCVLGFGCFWFSVFCLSLGVLLFGFGLLTARCCFLWVAAVHRACGSEVLMFTLCLWFGIRLG